MLLNTQASLEYFSKLVRHFNSIFDEIMKREDYQIEFIKTVNKVWRGDASKFYIVDVMFNMNYISLNVYL